MLKVEKSHLPDDSRWTEHPRGQVEAIPFARTVSTSAGKIVEFSHRHNARFDGPLGQNVD
jgi:hypothetical protein